MAAPANLYANSSSWMGVAIETTYGTPVALPTFWIPVKNPKITPVLTVVEDDALRGSMASVYDLVPTVRHDEYTFTTFMYYDALPYFMRSVLGSTDGISGTTPNYTHAFSLLNNALVTGNQPPSYTFFDFDGYQMRQMAMGQVDELGLKFTATGLVEVTVKILSAPYIALAGTTATLSTVSAQPSWDITATLNSVANPRVVEGEINFKRNSKPLHVLGQQGPYKIQVGALSVQGKMTVLNTDDTEQNWFLNGTQIPQTLLFTPPAAAPKTTTFQMSTCKLRMSGQERGGDNVIITSYDFEALPNATDATAGGVSPIKSSHVTAQATTY